MSKKQFIKRHLLIINKLKKTACSFEDLKRYLQFNSALDEENYNISLRTLQRDIKEIQSLYDIEIKYNRSEGVYEISNILDDVANERVFDSFMVLDTLKLAENFTEEIIFEQRKALGLEHVFILLNAIKNSLEIQMYYKKYWESEAVEKMVQPYFIKEVKHRWYVIGKEKTSDEIRTFGLDRINTTELTSTKFKKPSQFFLKSLFQNSFGIIYDEKPPQKTVLEFTALQANYVKSLPLHSSQKIIFENEEHSIIELYVHPTYDFIMEILSLGNQVKVLEPECLRKTLKTILQETLNNY